MLKTHAAFNPMRGKDCCAFDASEMFRNSKSTMPKKNKMFLWNKGTGLLTPCA
jgi:hypothetical protein